MKTYNKIEMTVETAAVDMDGCLMVLEVGDVLAVVRNIANHCFTIRLNEIGEQDVKVTSHMASTLCINNMAKIYEEKKNDY